MMSQPCGVWSIDERVPNIYPPPDNVLEAPKTFLKCFHAKADEKKIRIVDFVAKIAIQKKQVGTLEVFLRLEF